MPALVRTESTYWQDQILFDEMDMALQSLLALEEQSRGTPKWYCYKQALQAQFEVMETLHTQLENAAKNAWYRRSKGGKSQ